MKKGGQNSCGSPARPRVKETRATVSFCPRCGGGLNKKGTCNKCG